MCDARQEIIIPTSRAVLDIPSQAVEITIQAKIYLNGEIRTVQTLMDFEEIRTAVKEAEDYIGPDDIFTLTEKGEEWANWIKEQETNETRQP